MRENKEVLVLEDEQDWLEITKRHLKERGYSCIPCRTTEEACSEIDRRIADNNLPYAYLADALVDDPVTFEIVDYFAAKRLFEYILSKGIGPERFYLHTCHVSFEDIRLADELGIEIIRKGDIERFSKFLPKLTS